MTIQFTPSGVQIDTLQEIFDDLADQYRAIYGPDIDLSQDSPDGQRVGIEAKSRYDVQVFGLNLYNSMDPDLANGDALDRLLKQTGTLVRPATQSTWDIQVTTTIPVTLTADYQIKDELGQLWGIPSDVNLLAGNTTVTFQSVNFGSVKGLAGTALTQATVVLGVSGLTALVDALPGQDEETEPQVRRRRNRSLRNPAYTTTGSLYARLASTAGVTDLEIYDNDTKSYDAVRDIPANTLWVIIEGGTVADIAETYAINKNAGTGMKGGVSGIYQETRERPGGSTYIKNHVMKFDRPVYVPLYIRMTATRKIVDVPVNSEEIKARLTDLEFLIGEAGTVSAGSLYSPARGEAPNFFLTDLEVSQDGVSWTDEEEFPGYAGKFTLDSANITITEVIP